MLLSNRKMNQYDYSMFQQIRLCVVPTFDWLQNEPIMLESHRYIIETTQKPVTQLYKFDSVSMECGGTCVEKVASHFYGFP